MITNLIAGLILFNVGVVGIIYIFANMESKLHLLWLIPLGLFGFLMMKASLRTSIM